MSELQSPAQLNNYRSRPIPKISTQAALLQRDYFRYQQKQKELRFKIKTFLVIFIIIIISITNAIIMKIYFSSLIEKQPINCKYYTYSIKWDFQPRCQLCNQNFALKQGQCYKT